MAAIDYALEIHVLQTLWSCLGLFRHVRLPPPLIHRTQLFIHPSPLRPPNPQTPHQPAPLRQDPQEQPQGSPEGITAVLGQVALRGAAQARGHELPAEGAARRRDSNGLEEGEDMQRTEDW